MRIKGPARDQRGMASIVVVSVLIIILTLISLGFARIIQRSLNNSANRQFSAEATYAAESGINDVSAYLKKYATDPANAGSSYLPQSKKCTGPGSLIGSSTSQGPFYNYTDISGNSSTRYTCILLDPTPAKLAYGPVVNLKSQVVKVNTSAASGALDKLMISWQQSDNNSNNVYGYPTSTSNLFDQTTWNSYTSNCKSGGNNSLCMPMLRVTVIPISNGMPLSSAQAISKTVFLYPQSPDGLNIPVLSFTDNTNFKDGSLIPVTCNQKIGANTFTPSSNSSNSDYKCNIILSSLSTALASSNTDSVYLRFTPIYNQANIGVQANDKFGNSLNFIGDQAVVDVTAQTGGIAKRLQARVDTSMLVSGSIGIDTNISSRSDSIPEDSIRSANALCKRVVQDTPTNGFNDFVSFDIPDNVCHITSGTTIKDYTPTLDSFSIGGQGWNGSGYSNVVPPHVDSEEQSPVGSGYKGTLYIPYNGSATLAWTTTNAEYCTGLGGNSGDGWAGDKGSYYTFSGSPTVKGSGSQTLNNITGVTEYDLSCSRPLASGPSATKTVHAWPAPQIYFNNTTVTAGEDFSLSWTVSNSTSCTASADPGSPGNWSGGQSSSVTSKTFSKDMGNWPWDDTSSHTYYLTCYDPSGRSNVAHIILGKSQPTNPGTPGNPATNGVNPPSCDANTVVTDRGDGTAQFSWWGNCPEASPDSGTYYLYSTTDSDSSVNGQASRNGGPFITGLRRTITNNKTFCLGIRANAGGWGQLVDHNNCVTVVWPKAGVRINSLVGSYDNSNPLAGGRPSFCGDNFSSSNHYWVVCVNWTWSAPTTAGSMICSVYWNGSKKSGDIYERVGYGGVYNTSYDTFALGFNNVGTPNGTVEVQCHTDEQTDPGSDSGGVDCSNFTNAPYCADPPSCPYGGSWPSCNPPPPPSGGGGGGSGGGGGGGSGGGGGGGGGCFTGNTAILTPSGLKPISELKVGDQVETWDIAQGRLATSRIIFAYELKNKSTLTVVTDNGSVNTTSEHPFWTGSGWVQAKDLKPGTRVMDSSGRFHKVWFTMEGSNQDVYNFEVGNNNHDFFANNFLVHNILSL